MPPTTAVDEGITAVTGEELERLAISKPTADEVVEAIMRETSCSYRDACRVYELLGRAIDHNRQQGYAYHLTQADLDASHHILDAIMPDDTKSPAEDSTHALVHRHYLHDPEVALVHTKDGPTLEYCAITLELRSV